MGLLPSRDLVSGAGNFIHASNLVFADDDLTLLLGEMTRKAFPLLYEKLEHAFCAGRWIGTPILNEGMPLPGGVYLGRATLWKLQTTIHIDINDTLCAITNSGAYTGGEAIFPDLRAKLQ